MGWVQINGKRDHFSREDLITIGKSISLPKPEKIIDEMIDVISQWPDYAKQAGVRKALIGNIAKMHLV